MSERQEFEAKYLNVDKDWLRKELENIGAHRVYEERLFTRITFDNPKLKATHRWLRVRDEGDQITIAIKKDAKSMAGLKENEEVIESLEQVANFMRRNLGDELSGFDTTGEVTLETVEQIVSAFDIVRDSIEENYRERWAFGGITFDIDTWPKLNPYLEVESDSEEFVMQGFELLGLDYSKALIGPTSHVYDKEGIQLRDFSEIKFSGFKRHDEKKV